MIDYLTYSMMKRVFNDSSYYQMIRLKALELLIKEGVQIDMIEDVIIPIEISIYLEIPESKLRDFISINTENDDKSMSNDLMFQLAILADKMLDVYIMFLKESKFSEYDCVYFHEGKCPKIKCLCHNKSFFE